MQKKKETPSEANTESNTTKHTRSAILSPKRASLNQSHIAVLALFKEMGTISTIDAHNAGCMGISSRVTEMRDKGASISVFYRDIDTDNGIKKGVAHFILHGWEE